MENKKGTDLTPEQLSEILVQLNCAVIAQGAMIKVLKDVLITFIGNQTPEAKESIERIIIEQHSTIAKKDFENSKLYSILADDLLKDLGFNTGN